MDKEQLKALMKELLMENLVIDLDKESEYYGSPENINVKISFDGVLIHETCVYI